jgi:hypothetical protein
MHRLQRLQRELAQQAGQQQQQQPGQQRQQQLVGQVLQQLTDRLAEVSGCAMRSTLAKTNCSEV